MAYLISAARKFRSRIGCVVMMNDANTSTIENDFHKTNTTSANAVITMTVKFLVTQTGV